MRKTLAALIAVLICLPGRVSAQDSDERRVQILGLNSEEGDDDFARGLSLAFRMAAMNHPRWNVNENAVLLSQMRLAHGCDAGSVTPVNCYAQIAESVEADLLISGHVQRSSGDADNFEYIVNFELFDARTQRVTTVLRRFSRQASDAELANQFREVLRELMRNVEEVSVDSSSDAPDVRLAAPEEATPTGSPSSGYAPGQFGYLGWVSTGLAVVSAAVMVGGMTHLDSLNGDEMYTAYRRSVPVTLNGVELNACEEARSGNSWGASESEVEHIRSVCDQGETWEAAQYVFLTTTMVFAASAVIFHLLDLTSGDDGSDISLRPSVGPDGGGLSIIGSF